MKKFMDYLEENASVNLQESSLEEILKQVASGELTPSEAANLIRGNRSKAKGRGTGSDRDYVKRAAAYRAANDGGCLY
jgi:hypothetical protein